MSVLQNSMAVTQGSYNRLFPDVIAAVNNNGGEATDETTVPVLFSTLPSSLFDFSSQTTLTLGPATKPPKSMRHLVDEIVGFSVLAIFTIFIIAVLFLCLWANGKCYKRNKKTSRCCPHIDSPASSIISGYDPDEQNFEEVYYSDEGMMIKTPASCESKNSRKPADGVEQNTATRPSSAASQFPKRFVATALKLSKRRHTDLPSKTPASSDNKQQRRFHRRRSSSKKPTVSVSRIEEVEPSEQGGASVTGKRSESQCSHITSENESDDMAQATFGIDSLTGKEEYAKFLRARIQRLQSQQTASMQNSTVGIGVSNSLNSEENSAVRLNAEAIATMHRMQESKDYDITNVASTSSSRPTGPLLLAQQRQRMASASLDQQVGQPMKIGRFTIRTLSTYTPSTPVISTLSNDLTPTSALLRDDGNNRNRYQRSGLGLLHQRLSSYALTNEQAEQADDARLRPYSYSVSIKR